MCILAVKLTSFQLKTLIHWYLNKIHANYQASLINQILCVCGGGGVQCGLFMPFIVFFLLD